MRRMNRRIADSYASNPGMGHLVLLLTTTGRKSSLPRRTPLQYEVQGEVIYVAAARGESADWYRNILAHPQVQVQIGNSCFCALAEPITAPSRIADFLELRLERHLIMVRATLLIHGLPPWSGRLGLEKLGAKLALVAIRPTTNNEPP